MLVVGVLGQKGGVSKTCISANLAVAFSSVGRSVGCLDIDPQGTLEKWAARRDVGFPVVDTATHSNLERKLISFHRDRFDIVFVDTEGSLNQGTLAVAKFSDYVIIPCQPSIADLESIADSVEVVASRKLPYSVVLSRVSWLTKEGDDAEAYMKREGVNVAPCRLGERSSYRKSFLEGKGVLEYEPVGKASSEVRELYEYICGALDVPTGLEVERVA